MSTPFFDAVLYSGQNEPNHDGLRFSEPVGCLNGDMTAHEYKTLWYAAVSDLEKLQKALREVPSTQLQYADHIRRQHEAIVKLREALSATSVALRIGHKTLVASEQAEQALKDTEGL